MLPKAMTVYIAGGIHSHGLYFLSPDNPIRKLPKFVRDHLNF
jgi:hypothetical protein